MSRKALRQLLTFLDYFRQGGDRKPYEHRHRAENVGGAKQLPGRVPKPPRHFHAPQLVKTGAVLGRKWGDFVLCPFEHPFQYFNHLSCTKTSRRRARQKT